jgi:hypothetical protein
LEVLWRAHEQGGLGAAPLPCLLGPTFIKHFRPLWMKAREMMGFRLLLLCRPSTYLQSLDLPASEGLGNNKHVVRAFNCRHK